MELIERQGFLDTLHAKFNTTLKGEGHCVLLSGEAGIGKTSLVRAFCEEINLPYKKLQGTCDALFTPRPLAPLYDIAWQMQSDVMQDIANEADTTALFAKLLKVLADQAMPIILIFEDIHWADEATIDFIKFVARRITHLSCLFILTFRDNEIHSGNALRNIFGQLPPDVITRLPLAALSRQAVEFMAAGKGYSGDSVYEITAGNPFYVTEILASYSSGVPDNVKDSILSVYYRKDEGIKKIWTLLSIFPTGLESQYLLLLEPGCAESVENSLNSGILLYEKERITFKHELYRRTIEASLSPFFRVALNKRILELLLNVFDENQEIERIIHIAKNANEYDLVVRYAAIGAKNAARVGAHTESAKLYLSAIEYYQGNDKSKMLEFYEAYAYECYLTNKHKDAIIYITKALNLWKEKNEREKIGNCLRFLSRLWWFDGNHKRAEGFGKDAVEVLRNQPVSKAKAMAYSNMSQLNLNNDQRVECIHWAEKAIMVAKAANDMETLAHALNTKGSMLMLNNSTLEQGIKLVHKSLEIALKNSFHEQVARSYTTLGSNGVTIKNYTLAEQALNDGLIYCEQQDLDSQKLYVLSFKARLYLETGKWDEAYHIASSLLKNHDLLSVIKIGALIVMGTIKMRRGEGNALALINEAKVLSFETMELQRIIPVFLALLEYEWITGDKQIELGALLQAVDRMLLLEIFSAKSRLGFWLEKTGNDTLLHKHIVVAENKTQKVSKDVSLWEQWGCPYERALALFEASENDKRNAIMVIKELGADAVYEKLKLTMRAAGIKRIPRGLHQSTRNNTARLTKRQVDVLMLLKEGFQNKEIANKLFISSKTVDHHISSILLKLDVNSRGKAVQEALRLDIIS